MTIKRATTLVAVLAALCVSVGSARADYTTDYYGVTNAADDGAMSLTTPTYDSGQWCRVATAYRRRANLFGVRIYTYYEQVSWCWSDGLIRYAYRNRWGTVGSVPLWSWDGNVATNCTHEHCNNRGVGVTNAQVWTEGQFHACLGAVGINYCQYKYPQITINYNGSGGASASTSG